MIKEIERLKIDLMSRSDFKLHLLFKSIDKASLGYLTFGKLSNLVCHIFSNENSSNLIEMILMHF